MGVRQGENLYPVLFSLFLNDLEEFLLDSDCRPLNIDIGLDSDLSGFIRLLILLYADDTVMFADSRKGLQVALDKFHSYCEKWKLNVNAQKTKIVVFNGRKNHRDKFTFGKISVETVDYFKYLGICFSRTGNFFKCRKLAYDKAQNAMFSLLRLARNQELPLNIVLNLFQALVVPVLLYGCEIWGYGNIKILEKLQLKFLKHLFKLKRTTMTEMILGELGIYPLHVQVKVRMIRFWSSICTDGYKFSSKMYNILYKLHLAGLYTSDWLKWVTETLVETGYEAVWDSQQFSNSNNLCKGVREALQDNYVSEWRDVLETSSKCLFYKNFKHAFQREKYVTQLPDELIFPLIKFRCCCHKLMIEIGRHLGIPRNERFCKDCDMSDIGDEFHFIMMCPKYQVLRNQLLPKKYTSVRSVFNFCNLMSGSRKVMLNLSKFIKSAKIV
jgi:hypothetical protein